MLDSRLAILFWYLIVAIILRLIIFRDEGFSQIYGLVVILSLLAGIVIVLYRWWMWRTQEYSVTNRRLLNVSGIINKKMRGKDTVVAVEVALVLDEDCACEEIEGFDC